MTKKKKTVEPKIVVSKNIAVKEMPVNAFLEKFADQTIWHIAILTLLPFFIYIKTTGFQFIDLDDVSIIRNNFPILLNFKNILWSFKTDAFLTAHGDFYRPMQTVLFFIDAFIGGERPWIYHLTSLIVHLLTVLSLYVLLKKLGIKNLTALFAALLFSIHPLFSSAVSWIPALGDLLIGLFGILLCSVFITYLRTSSKLYFSLTILLFILALFSKETAVVFPILLMLYYWFLSGEKFNLKKISPLLILWAISFAFYYFLRSKVVTGTPPSFILGINPFIYNLPTIPIAIAKYLLPINLSTLPLFESSFTVGGMVLLIVLTILVIRFALSKQWLPVLGFAWFLLFIIPPMFFKLYYSKHLLEYYEHRLYLPSIGLLLLSCYLFDTVLYKKYRLVYYWGPLAVIAIFSFMSLIRSDDFRTSVSFFTNATNRGNAGACTKRGELLYADRDFNAALADFEKAIELSAEEYPPAFYNRGRIRAEQLKDHPGAEQDFNRTLLLDTSYIDAYISRANERVFTQNFPGAFQDVEKAKQFDSSNARIYSTLGKIYVNKSEFENAEKAFTKTIQKDSGFAEAYNDRAFVRYKLKDFNNALKDCNAAIALFPQFLNAYYNKGIIYLELKKPEIAIKTFDTTLALTNNFYFGYFYRGMAKKEINDMKGACDDWQQSVNLGFNMAQDTINKYCGKH